MNKLMCLSELSKQAEHKKNSPVASKGLCIVCKVIARNFDFPMWVWKLNTSLCRKSAEEMFQTLQPPSAGSGSSVLALQPCTSFCFLLSITRPVVLTLLSKSLKIYKCLKSLRNEGVQPKMPFRRSLIVSAGRKWSAAGPRWLTRGY